MRVPTPRRIAHASARRPGRVLAMWGVVLLAAFGLIGALMASATTTDVTFTNNPPSVRGKTVLEQRLGTDEHAVETVVVRSASPDALRTATIDLTRRLRGLDAGVVARVVGAHDPGAPPVMRSADGGTALIRVDMAGDVNDAERNIGHVLDVTDAAPQGVTAWVTGPASVRHANSHQAEKDLARGELMIGLPIALVILLLVFGTLGAVLLPLTVAICAIIVATAGAAVIGSISPLSFFVTNMITMMGLAVGIDYALFVVSRYREERLAGRTVLDAVDTASTTSGRAVGFSGIAVAVALAGLLIVPNSIFISLAVGAILAVVVAVAASMSLLPALLALMGDRVEWGGLPWRRRSRASDRQAAGFARVADAVMARPVVALVLATALLVGLGLPALGMRTGANGVATLPSDTPARQAYEVLERDFGAGATSPLVVTLQGDLNSPAGRDGERAVRNLLATNPDLGPPTVQRAADGTAAALTSALSLPPTSTVATGLVDRLQQDALPAVLRGTGVTAAVTGEASFNADYFSVTERYLPYVVALVLALSFVVLLVAFRSVVVSLVAIVMNLLSVGAAYGVLTLVFQHGIGNDLLGFAQVDVIDAWIPLFLFAVLFGLSMDYHVFLLSRIRERYDATGDTTGAVRHGIASSARLITGAAAIMVAVFAGFAMGELVMFQQMGLGLAVAILLDATVVRTVLVPAVMRLLGHRNWYLPRLLGFLPHVDVEAGAS